MNDQLRCKASTRGHRSPTARAKCPYCGPKVKKARSAAASFAAMPKLTPDEEYAAMRNGPQDAVWKRLTGHMEEAGIIPGNIHTDGEPLGYHMEPGKMHSWQEHGSLGFKDDPNKDWQLTVGDDDAQPWAWHQGYVSACSNFGLGTGRGVIWSGKKDRSKVSPVYMHGCDFNKVGILAGPDSLIRNSKFADADVSLGEGSGMTASTARRVLVGGVASTSRRVSTEDVRVTVMKDVEAEEVISVGLNSNDVSIDNCKAPVIHVGHSDGVEISGSGEQVFIIQPGNSTDLIRYPEGDAIFIEENMPFKSPANFLSKSHSLEGSLGLTDDVRRKIGIARLAKSAGIDRRNEAALMFVLENSPDDEFFGVDEWGRPGEGEPSNPDIAEIALRMHENPA